MNHFSKSARLLSLPKLRRLAIVFVAGMIMLVTTACSQPDTTARNVPDASQAAVERAQGNLSDQAIDEDVLSQQGASRARESGSSATPQS
ncbi:MAG: hypothetical protein WA885_12545 [Phormidesmis sp.]